MSHFLVSDPTLFSSLVDFDAELAEETLAKGCPHCKASFRFHQSHYPRKPRGIDPDHRAIFSFRDSDGTTFTGSTLGDTPVVGIGQTTFTNLDWIYSGGQQAANTSSKSLYAISALLTVAPASIPSLSEWTQLLLALMTIMLIGWHFHRERSY